MNHHHASDADALTGSAAADSAKQEQQPATTVEMSAQQQLLLQQQQLQMFQLQQQQLQAMSPGDLATMSVMAQQMLGMVMVPMMPFMMPMGHALHAAAASSTSQSHTESSGPTGSSSAAPSPAESLSDTLAHGTAPLPLMAPFAFPLPIASDDAPKRKRGRPPKKDVVARARAADAEKALKQFPMWGYGIPMPLLLSSFGSGNTASTPGALAFTGPGDTTSSQQLQAPTTTTSSTGPPAVSSDAPGVVDHTSRTAAPPSSAKGPVKKKSRSTGKPRGRPRTRPRPGEIIQRAKPAAIAPANYSVMYNYPLAGFGQHKSAELESVNGTTSSTGDASASHDDSRFATFGASLLSGERE